jgi:hypothetical protein
MIKRYKIGFRVDEDDNLCLLWDGGALVNLKSVLDAIQTVIDQLGNQPEWRNGAVLAYNAIYASATQKEVSK